MASKKAKSTLPRAARKVANDNAPIGASGENTDPGKLSTHVYVGETHRTVVYSDLPKSLPVLDSEVALIRGYMGDLVATILANDNESE